MKRSFTYLKSLLTLALAAFTGWMWAAELVIPYSFEGKTGNTEYAYEYQVKMPSEALTSFTTTIRYAGGSHRVEILSVKLLDGETTYTAVATGTDGDEVVEEGASYSGGKNYHNVYTFTNEVGFTANKVYTLQANLKVTNANPSHNGNIKVSGGITLEVQPFSFGVNFKTADAQNISTTTGAGFSKGVYAAPINWANYTADGGNHATYTIDTTSIDVSWGARGGHNSGCSTDTDAGKLLHGYLDDVANNGRTKATVTISGLPENKKYAVALVLSGDGNGEANFNNRFSPVWINNEVYAYNSETTLVKGDAAKEIQYWGSRAASAAAAGLVEGTNVMFVEGLSGGAISITSAMDDWNVSRLTIAGIQVWVTDEAVEAPAAPEDKETISLNFYSSQGSVSGEAGLVAAGGWNNLGNNGSERALNVWTGEKAVSYPMTLTYSSGGGYQWTSATDAFLKGYLDDGGNQAQISLTGIPFEKYSVIVYAATDTASLKFRSVTINGQAYIGTPGATTLGYALPVYNNTHARYGASRALTAAYGTNALRVDGLSGDLTIAGGANQYSARGGIAAIQIINTGTALPSAQIIDWTAQSADQLKTSELPELTNVSVQLKLADGATLEMDSDITGHTIEIVGNNVTVNVTNLEISQAAAQAIFPGATVTTAYTETIGVEIDGVTYSYFFRGTTDANYGTVANWYTGKRVMGDQTKWFSVSGDVAPGVGGNMWHHMLLDGDMMDPTNVTVGEDGYKTISATVLEGWNLGCFVRNGVHLTVATLNKIQSGGGFTTVWRVDDTSKITIGARGNSSHNNLANYYIDNEEGIVFTEFDIADANYYFDEDGSVKLDGVSGTQTIKAITLDLGTVAEGRKVVSRKVIGFNTSTATYTVAEDAVVTTTVEGISATAAISLQNVGDYKFEQKDDGYYVNYVAYSEDNEIAETSVWNNATADGLWETSGNWSGGIPAAGADAVISITADTTITIPDAGVTVGILTVNGEGTLTIAGGKITAELITINTNIVASETTLALAPMTIAEGKTVSYTTVTTFADPDSISTVNHELALKALTGEGTLVKKGTGVIGLFATAAEPAIVIEEGSIYVRETPATAMNIAVKTGTEIRLAAWLCDFNNNANSLKLEGGAQLTLANGSGLAGTITIAEAAETPAKICGMSFGAATVSAAITGAGKVEFADGGSFGDATKYPCDGATTYSGVISGELQVIVSDTSAVTFTGANTYTGGTEVAVGANLTLNGSVAGAVNVAGTLSGTGTMASLTLADGATLAGAVTVTGDVILEGTVNITHATAADAVVITCANAEAVAAALTGAPEGLKYIAEGGVVKLAEDAGSEDPGTGGEGGEDPDPEPDPEEDYVAQIGTTGYETLAAAIAAVQSGETITLLKDVAIDVDTEIATGVTLAITAGKTLTIPEGKTLTATGTVTGAVAGAGTIVYNGTLQAGVTGLTDANWTGTVKLDGITSLSGVTFANDGNATSTIELLGDVTGHLSQAGSMNAALKVTGSITFDNGWSNGGGYTFNGALLGEGTLATANTQTDVLKFLGETKDFAGTITVAGGHCIAFGEQADTGTAHEGKLIVAAGKTANIAAGKTWTAVNGIEVAGTIGGEGTIGSTLILLNGATLANAMTLADGVTVTVAEGTTINHTYATQLGDTVLICANAADVVAKLTCTLSGLAYMADGNAIKLTNGPERITLPALENAKWYYNGTEVAGSIEVNDNQSVTLQLKTDAGYLFADGTTSKDVTVNAGETTVTLPADATVVAAVAQIGETLYLTLEAALTAVQSGETITLLKDVAIDADTEIVTGVTLAIAGKTLTIPAGKTLTATGTVTGAVAGAGTIVYNGTLQAGVTGLTGATWTGTVKLDGIMTATNLTLSNYGNADSTIELGDLGSDTTNQVYFPSSTVNIPADVVVSGNVYIRNGSSGGVCNFTGSLSGAGALYFSDSSKSFGTLKFYGDVSGFTGTITCAAGSATRKLVFITETSATPSFDNGVTVADGYTLTANAIYTEALKVLGTIEQGTGTLAAVTFANGATLDASEGALVVTGDVTLPTDGTITVTLPADATIGTEVLTCANAEAIDTTKFSEAPEGLRYAADGTTIKLVEAKPDYVYYAVAGETNEWTDDSKWTLDGLPTEAPTGEVEKPVTIELTGATTLTVNAGVTLPVLTITGGDLTLDGSETLTTASLGTTNKVIVGGQLVLAGGTTDAPIAVANVIEVNNGTLTTDGYVNLSNENNKIGTSGTLVVANGVTSLNVAEQGIKGTTTIQAGATLKNVRPGDALAYNTSGVEVNVYGTLDMGETRWTIFAKNNTINAYAGATITGAGQGANGALDVLEKTTGAVAINVKANGEATDVTISAKIRFREGTTNVNIAEGVTATLSAGTNGLNNNNGALRITGAGTLKIADSAVYNIPVTVADATTTLVSANGKIKSLTLYGKLDSSKATLTTDTLTIYNGATLLNKPTVTGTVVIPSGGTQVNHAYATKVGDVVMTCASNANAKIVAALMKVPTGFYYVADGADVKLADRANAAVRLNAAYGYYTTFEEAYDALSESVATPTGTALDSERTISLLKDLTMEKERSYDFTELTLNLNGCNLMPQQCIFVGDSFMITNTGTTGKIDGEGAPYALWIGDIEDANTPDVEAATNVTIENLTIDGGLTLCNARNVTLRNLKVLNANYEAVYVDAESEAITIDGGAYEGNEAWGAIGFNTNEYTTTIPVEVTGTNLEMSPAPLKVPTGLSDDLIAWLKDVMDDGDMMVGSSALAVTDADLEQAYLLGIVPEVTDQNDVNVKSTFGVSDVVVDSTTVTLTVAIAVQAGALPEAYDLGGTVKLMAWETLDDMDAPVEVDSANYTVTVTRVSDTEATISVTPLVDTYKFFKIVVE